MYSVDWSLPLLGFFNHNITLSVYVHWFVMAQVAFDIISIYIYIYDENKRQFIHIQSAIKVHQAIYITKA